MDNKKIKELLKSANKMVMAKKFEETIEICQEILSLDDKNYMALVFLGAAQEGTSRFNETLKSYKQAIELDANQALAWQGLSKLYEKVNNELKSSNVEFFIKVFEKLNEILKNDDEKKLANSTKLCKVYSAHGKFDSAFQLVATLCPAHKEHFYGIIFDVEEGKFVLPDDPDLLKSFKEAGKVVSETSSEKKEKREFAWRIYVECCMKTGISRENLWTVVFNECPVPSSLFRNELLLKIHIDTYPEWGSGFEGSEVTRLLDSDNVYKVLYEAIQLMNDGNSDEAKNKLDKVLEEDRTILSAHLITSQCLHKLHRFKESTNFANKGLKLSESDKISFHGDLQRIRSRLNLVVAKNSLQSKDRTAFEVANEIILQLKSQIYVRKAELLSLHLLAAWKLNDLDQIEKLSKEAEQDVLTDNKGPDVIDLSLTLGQIALQQKKFSVAEYYFKMCIESHNTDPRGHLFMGILHWDVLMSHYGDDNSRDDDDDDDDKGRKDDRDERKKLFIECMNMSLKSDSNNPLPYYYIGLYVSKISKDDEKAKVFFMRAFDRDANDDDDIASSLIDLLLRVDDQEYLVFYLNKILERMKTECPKWVLLRLGAYHLNHGDIGEAISQLQSAVRRDVKDMKSWERLGEAYLQRGSYTSALKAFTKVVDNDSNALYSLYQIACIQQKLGLLKDAIDKFKEVIEMSQGYTPALFGLGECSIQLALSYISKCLFGRAVKSLQECITCLSRACHLNPGFSCLWKCLADSFTAFYKIPDPLINVNVPVELKLDESSTSLSKVQLLIFGEKCYTMALKLQPEASTLWHDLGLNYNYQVKVQGQTKEELSIVTATALNSLAKKGFQCLQKALSLGSASHLYWNSMGVITASKPINNYALSQHCFIKSIQQQGNNVLAWSNLGFLYLVNKKTELAHEAFKKAQSIEPLFVSSWIGQALIAEEVMMTGAIDHLEAMDLFRHSVETDNHPEAAISYAHWVCSTMDEMDKNKNNDDNNNSSQWLEYTFKHLNAVNSALDAMAKYTATRPDDIRGWNYYGLLCERQNLNRTSVDAFKRCLELLKSQKVEPSQCRVVLTNYARLLCKTGDYKTSLECYDDLCELFSTEFEDESPFIELCAWALCYFKNKGYEKSFKSYEDALQMMDDDQEEMFSTLVFVAMGTNLFLKGDAEDAKHFLFRGIGSQGKTLDEVLSSLLCLSLLQKDLTLTNAVLSEMFKIGGHSVASRSPHLAFLSSRAKFLLNKSTNAYLSTRDFFRSIHLQPDQSESWVRAAMILLSGHVTDDVIENVKRLCSIALLKSDRTCCQEALQCLAIVGLGESSLAMTPSQPPPSLSSPLSPSPLDAKRMLVPSFSLAQKLVHLYPDQLTNWCILLAGSQQQLVARQLVANDSNVGELKSFVLTTSKRVMDQVETASTCDRENPYLRGMHRWLSRQHAISLINMGRADEAEAFLQNVSWLYDDDQLLAGLTALLNNNTEPLTEDDGNEDLSKILASLVATSRIRNKKDLFEKHIKNSKWYLENEKLRNIMEGCLES